MPRTDFDTDTCPDCGAEIPPGEPYTRTPCPNGCDEEAALYEIDDSHYRRVMEEAGRGHLLLR